MKLSDISISHKLPVFMVGLAVASIVTCGVVSYTQSAKGFRAQAEDRLAALVATRANEMSGYLETIVQDLDVVAENETTGEALASFTAAYHELGDGAEEKLQTSYITDNPHPTGEKEKLDYAEDGSHYSELHKRFHPWFRRLLQQRAYYDIFLIDGDGDLVYSVYKELDYATNLDAGKWAGSDLGKVYREIASNPKQGARAFTDFAPYAPSHGAPASFIAQPVFFKGEWAGVIAFQMPIDRINNLMGRTAGLGETGETFLVGEDHKLRSDSRFTEELDILVTTAETAAEKEALSGKTGIQYVKGNDGKKALRAYQPLTFEGATWAVVASQSKNEVLASAQALGFWVATAGLFLIVLAAAIAILFARSIVRPVSALQGEMCRLAERDWSTTVSATDRGDEVGDMARAVKVFRENGMRADTLEEEQRRASETKEQQVVYLTDLMSQFDHRISDLLGEVGASCSSMDNTAHRLDELASHGANEAGEVARAASEASSNVQTVAAATEELSATISEVVQQINNSSVLANRAVDNAADATRTVGAMQESAARIGDVVQLITDIAEQTNLLALNATIEAARAGDAGKGFAVVASEVKSLAEQTAQATDSITRQITEMQGTTKESVSAINAVSKMIEEINSNIAAVAAASEQQNAATRDISSNIQHTARGNQHVTDRIGGVSEAAQATGDASNEVLRSVRDAREQIEALESTTGSFLGDVRDCLSLEEDNDNENERIAV